ncbi:hypothetical protein MRX96_018296 [Rhipicephalus microplus]
MSPTKGYLPHDYKRWSIWFRRYESLQLAGRERPLPRSARRAGGFSGERSNGVAAENGSSAAACVVTAANRQAAGRFVALETSCACARLPL